MAGATAAFFLLPGAAGPAALTSTTVAATTTTTWVSPHELRLGPVVVVATRLQMEGERVLFTYEVTPLTPPPGDAATEGSPEAVFPAAPASFTLTYPGGTASARALGPGQRSGRFEVPAGVTLDQVQAISIDSHWVAVPLDYTIDLSPSTRAWVPASPGLRARILRVTEQAESLLVVVEVEGDAVLASDIAIAGEGREWWSSIYSEMDGPHWTLDFRGEALPDPISLTVRGVGWVEMPGGGPVSLEGLTG